MFLFCLNMNREDFKSLVKNVDTQLFELVSNLICSICQEFLNKPVTTPCGHSFCSGCIKRVLASKDNSGCPLCKNPVKRYCLESDKAKFTLCEICKELPSAFEEDVKELSEELNNIDEDLIRTFKLSRLCNQECVKESKATKRKSTSRTRKAGGKAKDNESGSLTPVLKRSKRVVEYASAKKKRLDDLVSISQTDPASNSSFCGSSDLDKKLEKIEKLRPEEKVAEWFNAVGDNIYINSPNSSIAELPHNKNGSEEQKGKEEKSSMIRVDYNKGGRSSAEGVDPYEFIPSQNRSFKKKRQKKAAKKIPDFKALQSFTKESLKRSSILQQDDKYEEIDQEDRQISPGQNIITASQKFDQLLSETKKNQIVPTTHVLYSASQVSSPRFLDCSFHSKVEVEVEKGKTNRKSRKLSPGEEQSYFLESKGGLFKDCATSSNAGQVQQSKRRRSRDSSRSEKKKKFSEVIETKTDHALPDDTKAAEQFKQTKLVRLLKELVEDEVIYSNHQRNAALRLSEMEKKIGVVTQSTDLIGFCTQEECPEEKRFKKMVEDMEKELNSKEFSLIAIGSQLERSKVEEVQPTHSKDAQPVGTNNVLPLNSLIAFNLLGRISKTKASFVDFLQLGRLTPVVGRSKSSVVKLVFPMGFSSFSRRKALQTKFEVGVQTSLSDFEEISRVSAGIQTSQMTMTSTTVQTSQVEHSSATIQTTQEVRPSVEIQTTQRRTSSAGIQTTQVPVESIHVQTSQNDRRETETPLRKPVSRHRKVIRKEDSPIRLIFSGNKKSGQKDLITPFDEEKGLEENRLRKTQKHHEYLVERKNIKNQEHTVKRSEKVDGESDDSDVQPPKKLKTSRRILSQDSLGKDSPQKQETPQMNSPKVRKNVLEDEMEVIDLGTPKSENSDEQMLQVLKNIDLDLVKCKTKNEDQENEARGEKSDESDSDFFVEQTPPSLKTESKNLSRSRRDVPKKEEQKENSEGTDLIGDSIPKGFSESFLLLSAPQKMVPNPESSWRTQSRIEFPDEKPNENDQNQLNANVRQGNAKTVQLKAVVEAWKRSEPPAKRGCVVASSVKDPDMIKRFASKFKLEYSNKPTKDMTHLIVGLHESDYGKVLPFCTPKLLFAMANKKWVVSELWAETSLKMNTLLPEEKFETLDPVGGCGCRKARLSSDNLLTNCEVYLLGAFQKISKEELSDLILDCGGSVVPGPEKFSFLPSKLRMIIADCDCLKMDEKQLQDLHEEHSTVILSRDVIVNSIQSYELVNFSPYLLHLASEETLLKLGYPSVLVRNEEGTAIWTST